MTYHLLWMTSTVPQMKRWLPGYNNRWLPWHICACVPDGFGSWPEYRWVIGCTTILQMSTTPARTWPQSTTRPRMMLEDPNIFNANLFEFRQLIWCETALVDFFLYAWKVPEFQKGYRKILCCHRKSRIIQIAPWSSVEPFRSSLPLVPRRQYGVTLSGQATAMKADKTGEGRRGHPAWSSVNLDCFWVYQSILTRFYNDGLWENICLTSLTRAKCGVRSTLCWKIPNISGSIELFAL